MAEFPSVVSAVQCAVEVQKVLVDLNVGEEPDRALRFRIGIHVGDVMVRGGDLLGDGVNIATRLEALAEPGGVCISGDAHRQVRKVLPVIFHDLGPQQIKNIEEPVHAFTVEVPEDGTANAGPEQPARKLLLLPDKPSIAVLPFTNMSGDPEQEYFADGVVEDIITALSRVRWLFVIARNSSFTYKGKAVDIRQVGRELGVRYVLEGSIRKAGARVRLTGQLIEAESGHHVWADKFDGDLSDIFELQDSITENVLGAIEPNIRVAEIERARQKPPTSLTTYDLYLRSLPLVNSQRAEDVAEAIRLLHRAIELDPRYVAAIATLVLTTLEESSAGRLRNPREELRKAVELGNHALSISPNDLDALVCAGRIKAYTGDDFAAAASLVKRATELYPSSALAWSQRGSTSNYLGDSRDALQSFEKSMRLSPLDMGLYQILTGSAVAYIQLGEYEKAVEFARKSEQQNSLHSSTYRCLAAAYAHLSRFDEAKAAAQHLLKIEPDFTITRFHERCRWKPEAKRNYAEGMRLAGLPE